MSRSSVLAVAPPLMSIWRLVAFSAAKMASRGSISPVRSACATRCQARCDTTLTSSARSSRVLVRMRAISGSSSQCFNVDFGTPDDSDASVRLVRSAAMTAASLVRLVYRRWVGITGP
jgi:hypothetical protein